MGSEEKIRKNSTVLTGRMALLPHKRLVLNMQGQTIAAGATLTQIIDLSGYERALFGTVFATAFTGNLTLTNRVGSLFVGAVSGSPSAVTTSVTSTLTVLSDNQMVSLTNNGASAVLINTAEVIAQ